jgi:transposase
LKLMAEQGCSKPLAAKAVNCSVSALFWAKKATEENRDIGKGGRPRNLNPKEEAQLIGAIVDADIANKPLTYKRLREVVWVTPSTLFFIFIHFFLHNTYILS